MFFFTSHKTREGSEMSEDETKKLSDRRLLQQIATRLQKLEEDRAGETKLLLGEIRKELADFRAEFAEFKAYAEARLQRIEGTLEVLSGDVLDVRTEQRILERRVTDLERPKQ
jgi:hypothetical protein